jgi:formylmethanofuran dehydrogenase subunit D
MPIKRNQILCFSNGRPVKVLSELGKISVKRSTTDMPNPPHMDEFL